MSEEKDTLHQEAAEINDADQASEVTDSNENQGAPEAADKQQAELLKQVEEAQQRYLRSQADFDNFRRRTIKEREELAKYASQGLVSQLVPVLDNFERAVIAGAESQDAESLQKGIEMIFRQLAQVLEQEGLKPLDSVGQPFNPEFHQAIMQVESEEYDEGIVVEEVQKGYMLKDKVIRPAMVKVSG